MDTPEVTVWWFIILTVVVLVLMAVGEYLDWKFRDEDDHDDWKR